LVSQPGIESLSLCPHFGNTELKWVKHQTINYLLAL